MKKDKAYILKTSNVYDGDEAIREKMKQIHPKMFGLFCPVKYKLISSEKVYVPYMYLVFDYRLVRSSGKNRISSKVGIDREGKIGIVYDMNEAHAFHYDLFDKLQLVKTFEENTDNRLLKATVSESEAISNSIECVKWQYLRKVFHAVPEITLIENKFFYREAIKLNLECRGKHYEKFAYKDMYGAKSEHISGLRVRLDI